MTGFGSLLLLLNNHYFFSTATISHSTPLSNHRRFLLPQLSGAEAKEEEEEAKMEEEGRRRRHRRQLCRISPNRLAYCTQVCKKFFSSPFSFMPCRLIGEAVALIFFPPIHFRLRRLFLYSALGGGGKGRDDLSSSLRRLKKRRAV